MRQKLILLLTIISLSLLFSFDREQRVERNNFVDGCSIVAQFEQSFSSADNFVDHHCRRGSSTSFSTSQTQAKSVTSRRTSLVSLGGVKLAVANLYSERSYAYSCSFPFDHQPQRYLFFKFRNIRI